MTKSSSEESSAPDCEKCPLAEKGRSWGDPRFCVRSKIVPDAPLFFLGMNPAAEEVKQGRPFAPRGGSRRINAGTILAKMLEYYNLKYGQDYSIGNIAACTAPNNQWKTFGGSKAVKACASRLQADLEQANPEVIVTLGADALRASTQRIKGALGVNRGRVRESKWGTPVLPTFHPAYFLPGRNPNDTELERMYDDIKAALDLANGKIPRKKEISWKLGKQRPSGNRFVLDVEVWVDPGSEQKDHIRCIGYLRAGKRTGNSHRRVVVVPGEPAPGSLADLEYIGGHHIGSDLVHLINRGILPRSWKGELDDSMVLQSLKDENIDAALASFALDQGYGDYLDDYHACVPLWTRGEDPPEHRVRAKNAGDVQLTMDRLRLLHEWMAGKPVLLDYYHKFLQPCIRLAAELELNGLYVSPDVLREVPRLRRRIEYRRKKIREIAGWDKSVNPRGNLARRELLFTTLNLPVLKVTEKKQDPQLSRDHLGMLSNLPLNDREKWKELDWIPANLRRGESWHDLKEGTWKTEPPPLPHPDSSSALKRYVELSFLEKQMDQLPWLANAAGKIVHPRYNLGGTGKYESEKHPVATGRWSAMDPNPQLFATYLKRHIRSRYEDGWIVQWDASQMEVRVALEYSQDPELKRIFEEGLDPYLDCSGYLFGDQMAVSHRFMGKRTLLATLFGTGAPRLTQELNGDLLNRGMAERVTTRECGRLIAQLKRKFKVHTKWVEDVRATAVRTGTVRALTGRTRSLPNARSYDRHALNQACNFPIQSLASDLNLLCALKLGARFSGGVLITVVHDSGVGDVKSWAAVLRFARRVRKIWGNLPTREYLGFDLKTPMKVEIEAGKTWGNLSCLSSSEVLESH